MLRERDVGDGGKVGRQELALVPWKRTSADARVPAIGPSGTHSPSAVLPCIGNGSEGRIEQKASSYEYKKFCFAK